MKKIIVDPDLDQGKERGYYFEIAKCTNCDEDVDVMIPEGMLKPKLEKYECPNCKCITLEII